MEIGYNSEYRREGSSYQNSSSHMRLVFGATVSWLLNLIGNCFGFAFLRSMITPLYQPIKFKTKPSRVLLDRVCPRCRLLTYFYFDFSLTPQPIKFKTKTSRVLVDRVFPRCRKLTYFYSDFSLTPQPIKLKTKTNRVLVDHVFPRFRQLRYFYFDFSLAPSDVSLL